MFVAFFQCQSGFPPHSYFESEQDIIFWNIYHGGVQRAGVWLRVGRGGAVCEDEVLLEEEEGDVLFVDGDPLPPVPVQVVVLHQHLKEISMQMSTMWALCLFSVRLIDLYNK